MRRIRRSADAVGHIDRIADVGVDAETNLDRLIKVGVVAHIARWTVGVVLEIAEGAHPLACATATGTENIPFQVEQTGARRVQTHVQYVHPWLAPCISQRKGAHLEHLWIIGVDEMGNQPLDERIVDARGAQTFCGDAQTMEIDARFADRRQDHLIRRSDQFARLAVDVT
jgi:hypothetical protein